MPSAALTDALRKSESVTTPVSVDRTRNQPFQLPEDTVSQRALPVVDPGPLSTYILPVRTRPGVPGTFSAPFC